MQWSKDWIISNSKIHVNSLFQSKMMFYPTKRITHAPWIAPTIIPWFSKVKKSLSNIFNISNAIMPKTAAVVKRLVVPNGSMGGSKPNIKKIFNLDQNFSLFYLVDHNIDFYIGSLVQWTRRKWWLRPVRLAKRSNIRFDI